VAWRESLAAALAEKRKHPELSFKALARMFYAGGLGPSHKAIRRYYNEGIDALAAPAWNESKLALGTHYLEQRLVHYLLFLSDGAMPMNDSAIIQLASGMARDLGTLPPGKDLSRHWLRRFKQRRPGISSRIAEQLTSLRSQATTPEQQKR
jgi:hypothetical protein